MVDELGTGWATAPDPIGAHIDALLREMLSVNMPVIIYPLSSKPGGCFIDPDGSPLSNRVKGFRGAMR